MLEGETVTVVSPVPVRVTLCGEFAALSVTVMLPVSGPVAVGVNVGVIVQFAPAVSVAGQVFVCPKFVLAAIAIGVDDEPVLVTVIIEPEVVLPTAVAEKLTLEGATVTVVAPLAGA
jgi:hypothetical protein